MTTEETEVVVVGAGQAGIAMSEHLTSAGIPHVVLEKGRVAEHWRSMRWDSLVMNGPAWHDRFPNLEFESDPEGFPKKDEVARYFERYVEKFDLPVRTGVTVTSVTKNDGHPGWTVESDAGTFNAHYVVAATGPFQHPAIPPLVPQDAKIHQIHSSQYHNPEQLPEGNVMVIGAGSSGVQIADELQRCGRDVTLAVGPHDRPPRRYRGRDFVWWLGVLNKWEAATPPQGAEHVTIAVSGANGGQNVDFRDLASLGVTLVGRANGLHDGVMTFADDLKRNIDAGDENLLGLLREADAYIAKNGLDLPDEPELHELGPYPESVTHPILEMNLAERGITSIVWATGFRQDYSWIHIDAFDERGRPLHTRGISPEPGIFFLGLPWQSRRGSSFIWGVWHDAKFICDHIQIQRSYRAYDDSTPA